MSKVGRKVNVEMREKVAKLRQKRRTYWEISRILNISPQLAFYYGKKLSTKGMDKPLTKK